MKKKTPTAQDFREKIESIILSAERNGELHIDINSGDVHRQVGGYPKRSHRMRDCCSVMRQFMKPEDEILDEPPSGQGASLTIRYYLPR